jgi:hypothetical protein
MNLHLISEWVMLIIAVIGLSVVVTLLFYK